jgi:hypothetical protein
MEVWSSRAETAIRRLVADLPPHSTPWVSSHAERLGAVSVGGSMWAWYFLRPNGEVVVVGEDEDRPDVDSVYSDRSHQLRTLVWLSRRHPELASLLPEREPGATDCRCTLHSHIFGPDRVLCSECGALGWLPAGPAFSIAINSAWLSSSVVSLAQAIYDDRTFDRLPILADALEDAGCTNQDILNHCRQPGEHCRGCWVVDLLLGKE